MLTAGRVDLALAANYYQPAQRDERLRQVVNMRDALVLLARSLYIIRKRLIGHMVYQICALALQSRLGCHGSHYYDSGSTLKCVISIRIVSYQATETPVTPVSRVRLT